MFASLAVFVYSTYVILSCIINLDNENAHAIWEKVMFLNENYEFQ